MAREKFTAAEIIQAIERANGVKADAARMLGCSRGTVDNYIDRYATVKAAYEETNETNIDFVEQELMKQIKSGNITAIIFFLKTKGKHRGYVERTETDVTSGGEKLTAQPVNITYDTGSILDDLTRLGALQPGSRTASDNTEND